VGQRQRSKRGNKKIRRKEIKQSVRFTAHFLLVFFSLLCGALWGHILFASERTSLSVYFFDVGQGDSGMVTLPSGASMLIDGGRGARVLAPLDRIFRRKDRYIDLVFLSHPQQDHFGGLLRVVERYRVGAFLLSTDQSGNREFRVLLDEIAKRKIPLVVLEKGDRVSQKDAYIEVLSPQNASEYAGDVNQASLVLRAVAEGTSILFTGDIGQKTERKILAGETDIRSQILKVPHHGSKYSSSKEFLAGVSPSISVIGVGKNNYGHPTKEVLQRLYEAGSEVLRTDLDGTVKILVRDGIAKIFTHALR